MSLDAPAFAFVTDVAHLCYVLPLARRFIDVCGGKLNLVEILALVPAEPNMGRTISENIAKAEAQAQRR
ncbi:hypothetical protein RugamoR57_24850 [Duganella caerulea]|uniref:hypothetical protein n=1 Tax=Duganella caerulea TaxID=2885762 RepID=UPI0030E841FE